MKLTNILPDGEGYKVFFAGREPLTITASHINQMRLWAADCEWLDSGTISDYSNMVIIRGVNRHFDGGLTAFLSTCN